MSRGPSARMCVPDGPVAVCILNLVVGRTKEARSDVRPAEHSCAYQTPYSGLLLLPPPPRRLRHAPSFLVSAQHFVRVPGLEDFWRPELV